MAHSLSAKKRIRQNEKHQARNRARRTVLKSRIRHCRDELQRGTVETAETALRQASSALDHAAIQHTIHRNAAARRKSRMARKLNALKLKAAG
ncbi:MAG: 30S ribosomal protein S20 [Planctomycetota bacterium]